MYIIKIITELIHQVAHTLMGCDRSLLLLLHQLKLRGKKSLHHFIKHNELELSPKSTVKHLTATYCSVKPRRRLQASAVSFYCF